jgi:hypothetical protein
MGFSEWVERKPQFFIVIAGLDPAIQGPSRTLPLDPRVKPEDDSKIEYQSKINTLQLRFFLNRTPVGQARQ